MRWNISDKTRRHRWFAWYPVEVDGHIVWLETVWRKKSYDSHIGYSWLYDFDKPEGGE